MRIVSVVGTRPQLIKAAALFPTLRARHDDVFVDTGQHWDEAMAGTFFAELGLPKPDHALGIGGGTAADQVGRMIAAARRRPRGREARCRPRLRRHELDARRRPRRGDARHPGRSRGGRPAELRPADARGDEPGPHRSRLSLAVRTDTDGGREPRRRRDPRGRRPRWRRPAGPRGARLGGCARC